MFYILLIIILIVAVIFLTMVSQELLIQRIPILMYHRFIEAELYEKSIQGSEKMFTMPDKQFREQMRFLKNAGYQFLHFEELLDILNKKSKCPRKPILITFDDGFHSIWKYAFPVMKKENIKSTIFLTTDHNAKFFEKFKHFDKPLSDEEIRILHNEGVSIQSHAHTHKPLVGMKEDEIVYELEESKARIEKLTGSEPKYIAIPGGFLNKRVRKILLDSGFQCICTSLAGTNSLRTSPLSLKRLISEGTYTGRDFEKSLKAFNIAIKRIISFFKRTPTKIINPDTWLTIRKKIYDSWMGRHLTYKRLRIYFLAIIILFIILIILSTVINFIS